MKTLITIIIMTLVSTVSVAYASDSSLLIPTISVKSGSQLSCPNNYVLRVVKQSLQTQAAVKLAMQAHDAARFGYVKHETVALSSVRPEKLDSKKAVALSYVCQKVSNHWGDAMVAGVRA